MIDKKIKIKLSLGRNKYEYLYGYINHLYSNILVVSTDKGIKTISYSDIITQNVVITKFH